jgi:hypothetical protein
VDGAIGKASSRGEPGFEAHAGRTGPHRQQPEQPAVQHRLQLGPHCGQGFFQPPRPVGQGLHGPHRRRQTRGGRQKQAAAQVGSSSGPDELEETRRAERLEVYKQVVFWTTGKRSAIASDLIAGRLTLFEAAAGFRAVRQVREKYVQPASVSFPGQTEDEQLCRQVLVSVEARLRGDPARAAVVARLRKELQEHLERYGTVHLPASPDLDPRF